MKKYGILSIPSVLIVLYILTSCSEGGGTSLHIPDPDESVSVSAGSYYVETLTDTGSFTYTHDVTAGDDIYFIFTNYSDYNLSSNPYIKQSSGSALNSSIMTVDSYAPDKITGNEGIIALRGSSEIDAMYPEYVSSLKKSVSTASNSLYNYPVTVSASITDDPPTLYDDYLESAISVTRRGLVSLNSSNTAFGAKTLEVWVEDDEWSATDITQEMVDALCNAFLLSGLNNDIYDWVTGIYGEEWGTTAYSNLIGETNTIIIFLHDIEGDGIPSTNESRIVGYYSPKHNFTSDTYTTSNECIRFSLDAPLFAEAEGTWEISDYWPQECISALAHEFQHMIHFYQKQVSNNVYSTDTWINEMCSMVTEDFVANKIAADGPRGIAYNDPSDGGVSGVTSGYLPHFTYWDEAPLTQWNYLQDDITSYSTVYSFGSYLARNFGGAALFKSMVQNSYSDSRAILSAISDIAGVTETMESLLVKWGVAVVLSDDDSTLGTTDLHYNIGANWEPSTINGITYQLGSINLYNYYYSSADYDGPYFYSDNGAVGYFGSLAQSNIYCHAGTASLSGTYSWNINVPKGTRLTVVIK